MRELFGDREWGHNTGLEVLSFVGFSCVFGVSRIFLLNPTYFGVASNISKEVLSWLL